MAPYTDLPRFRSGQQNKYLLVFGLAAWCLMLVLPTRLPIPQPDPSWQSVLNYAAAHHLQHGTDIVFTYGPLGYLAEDSFSEDTWMRVTLFQLVIHALYVLLVIRTLRVVSRLRLLTTGQVLLFAVAAVWLPALDKDAFYLLFIIFVGTLVCSGPLPGTAATGGLDATEPANSARPPLAPGALELIGLGSLGIISLLKATYLVLAVAVMACVVIRFVLNGRRGLALLMAGLYGAAFLLGWRFLAHQQWANLGPWFRGSFETMRAYPAAMGRWEGWGGFVRGLLVLGLLTWFALQPLRRTRTFVIPVLLFLGGAALAWKQSFTRADEHHAICFFICALVLAALLPLSTGYRPQWQLLLALAVLSLWGGVFRKLPAPLSRAAENVRWVLALPQRDATWANYARAYDLPEIRKIVGSGSVDVQGWEQAIAILNGLNYRPAPVFQSYAAGTRYLAERNAAFYRSEQAPEFILTRGSTVDERLANLDQSLSGLVIAQQYQMVACESGYRLLRRVAGGDQPLTLLCAGTVSAGDPLPAAAGQWCEIVMRENWLGRFIGILWASPPVYIEESRPSTKPLTRRFVPSMASCGFVAADDTKSLRIKPSLATKTCFAQAIGYRIYSIPGGGAWPAD